MMNRWWTDDEQMMNRWWTDDELMVWSGLTWSGLVSLGQAGSVWFSLATHQTVKNTQTYKWMDWIGWIGRDHWTTSPLEHRSLSGANNGVMNAWGDYCFGELERARVFIKYILHILIAFAMFVVLLNCHVNFQESREKFTFRRNQTLSKFAAL